MLEKEFESKIKDYLVSKGAYVIKIHGSGYSQAGVPDLLVCYKSKFIGIEVKTEKGKTTELQNYHINKIRECKGIAVVIRPSDFGQLKLLLEVLDQ